MEERVRRDAEIERDFGFTGSFLDLDVVDSHGMKVAASRPEHIIVSFERFRSFASQVVQEHEGQVLNSNGDELMCFFSDPAQAVRAAAALLERLAAFNAHENLLSRPFRVRQGIHSGSSLVDRVRGVAYSPVLDVAGHLQKYAPVDGLLASAETVALLPPGMRFAPAGEVGKEKVAAYRFEVLETATPPGEE
jgi:class 3 adenylate cyclase